MFEDGFDEKAILFCSLCRSYMFVNGAALLARAVVGPFSGRGPAAPLHSRTYMNGYDLASRRR